ncbi:hypothetical protein C8R44DRAFT_744355 [Mycena epipterygia]|nr:hypothetical protein C8R44DRAFT_744355 [Mycena epipterygia]
MDFLGRNERIRTWRKRRTYRCEPVAGVDERADSERDSVGQGLRERRDTDICGPSHNRVNVNGVFGVIASARTAKSAGRSVSGGASQSSTRSSVRVVVHYQSPRVHAAPAEDAQAREVEDGTSSACQGRMRSRCAGEREGSEEDEVAGAPVWEVLEVAQSVEDRFEGEYHVYWEHHSTKACHECGSPASYYGLTRDNTHGKPDPRVTGTRCHGSSRIRVVILLKNGKIVAILVPVKAGFSRIRVWPWKTRVPVVTDPDVPQERWGHVHVKARAQDVNAVGSKFDEEAHIANSTSAVGTLNDNKHKVSAPNATPLQYRVKEDVSNDEHFEGAQERFHCLRLDTRVDELDEAMNEMYIV